jgi:hypothetical protein
MFKTDRVTQGRSDADHQSHRRICMARSGWRHDPHAHPSCSTTFIARASVAEKLKRLAATR